MASPPRKFARLDITVGRSDAFAPIELDQTVFALTKATRRSKIAENKNKESGTRKAV
jgi:hypothetical protein